MRTRAILSAFILVAAGIAAVLPANAARAAAPAPVPLTITRYYQMAVDSVHHQIFISEGIEQSSAIFVYDFSGNLVTEIEGQSGVMGIALSPDDSTLYAVLPSPEDEVTAISTATLQQTGDYLLQVSGGVSPVNIAMQSDKLWVSYTTANSSTANIGDFDLSTPEPNFEPQPAMGNWLYSGAPELAADPGDHNVLVAWQAGNSAIGTFDTATDPVTPLAGQTSLSSCSQGRQVAVLDGGAQFAYACQGSSPLLFDTANVAAPVGSFAMGTGIDAVALAVSPDGYLAAGSQQSGISVFTSSGDAVSTQPLSSSLDLATRGLGWSADDSDLFAVAQTAATGSWVLQVIPDPTKPTNVAQTKPALNIRTAPGATSYAYGKQVEVHATLGSGVADRVVSIYVTPVGQQRKLLLTGTVNSQGQLDVGYRLTRTSTFTAVFAGDAHNLPASAAMTVRVSARVAAALAGSYKTTTIGGVKYHVFRRSAVMRLLATVTPNKSGECVRAERAEFSSSHGWASDRLYGCAKLSAASQAKVSFSLKGLTGHRFRIRADYVRAATDTANLSADSGWLYFEVTA